jgi:AraC-like DNA-binding protein
MSYRELPPPPALRPFVDRFWVRMPDAADGEPETLAAPVAQAGPSLILPDGCIDVLIDVRTGAARVVGTMTRAVVDPIAASGVLASVRFKPGAAPAFLRVPAAGLTDRVVGADELGCSWLCAPPAPEGSALAVKAVLGALQRSLLERSPAASLQREVREATRRLFGARAPTVDALARELGRSRQHLARQFREHVGVGPKEFARVARLQRAIAAVQRGVVPGSGATGSAAPGLAGLALELGYFDQAHMSRDFNDLAGLTPRAAREARGSIFPIPSLWLEP